MTHLSTEGTKGIPTKLLRLSREVDECKPLDSGESPLKLPTGVAGTLARTSSSGRHGFGAGGMTKDGKPKRVARTLRRGLTLL
jgi:hypothetical protein